MAQKDPRFNFYPDNWLGGTDNFTLEQEGAYLALILLQFRDGRFTAEQAFDKLMQRTRGNTAVCTALWKFLVKKFETDGKLFWNTRLELEIARSEKHSNLQRQRINKRWHNTAEHTAEHTNLNTEQHSTNIPVNAIGIGNGIGIKKEVPQSFVELNKAVEENLKNAFDEIYREQQKIIWREIDFDFELKAFCNKVRGSPEKYNGHDTGGLRLALQSQLRQAKPITKKKIEPNPGKL